MTTSTPSVPSTTSSFAASATSKPLDPNYPEGDLYTQIDYLDLKGEELIASSKVHVGSNTAGGGLQIEMPDVGEISRQMVQDVASGVLSKEQALEAKFVRIPDFGNTHMTRFDLESYASLQLFGLYENAEGVEGADRTSANRPLAIAREIYPTAYAAHQARRSTPRELDIVLP